MKKILLLVMLALSTVSFSQKSVLLRLNYNVGDKYLMSISSKQDMAPAMVMSMDIEMNMDVTGKKDENFLTESKVTHMKMDMMQGGMAIQYDSSTKDEDLDEAGKMMKTQMAPMLSAITTTIMSPRGEIVSSKTNSTAAGSKDLANQNSVVYPEKSVKEGDSWSSSKTNNNITINTTYTVKEILKDVVKIDVSGQVTNGASGTVSGAVLIDKAMGIPKDSKMLVELELQGQKMKSEVHVTMKKQ